MNDRFKLTLENEHATCEITIIGYERSVGEGWLTIVFETSVTSRNNGRTTVGALPILVPDDATDMDIAVALVGQMKAVSSKEPVKDHGRQETETPQTFS